MKKPPNLQSALLGYFVALAVVPILLLGWVAYTSQVGILIEEAQSKNLLLAQTISGQMGEALLEPATLVGYLPELLQTELVGDDLLALEELLERTVRASNFLESLALLDAQGRVVAVGLVSDLEGRSSEFIGLDYSTSDFYRRAQDSGMSTWSQVFLSISTGEMSLALAVPAGSNMLLGTLNIEYMEQLVHQISQNPSIETALLDQTGALIFHPRTELARQRFSLRHLPPVREGLKGKSITARYEWGDEAFMGSVAPVRETGWLVLVSQPKSIALASAETLRALLLKAVLFTALVATAVSLVLARRLTRPLTALKSSTRQIADGDYSLELPPQTAEETQSLADSFRQMALAVQDREQQLQTTLQQAETTRDQLETILQSVADALVVTDKAKNIVAINRTAQDLFDFHPREAQGHQASDVLSHPRLTAQLDQAWKGDAPSSMEIQLRIQPEEAPRYFRSDVYPVIQSDDDTIGMVSSLREVTLERASDRAKNEFISMAAHELRTPLTAVLGSAELLIMDLESRNLDQEQRRECLSMIAEKAEALEVIISDLLDLGRIESGRPLVLDREETDLRDMIIQVAESHQNETRKHHIMVNMPEGPLTLLLDRPRLYQVFDNLVGNAVKYSPDGGTIRLIGMREENAVWIRIKDEGLGIPEEQQPYIFDSFYRAHPDSPSMGGFGLGLSICKLIVEAHDGQIDFESRPGQGSTFTVRLPI